MRGKTVWQKRHDKKCVRKTHGKNIWQNMHGKKTW